MAISVGAIEASLSLNTRQFTQSVRSASSTLAKLESQFSTIANAATAFDDAVGKATRNVVANNRAMASSVSDSAKNIKASLGGISKQYDDLTSKAGKSAKAQAQSLTSINQVVGKVQSSIQSQFSQSFGDGLIGGIIGGAAAGIAVQALSGIKGAIEDIISSGLKLESLNAAFTAITGSTQAAGKEMQFLREQAERLGFYFPDLAEGFKGIAAAARGTSLEGKGAEEAFLAIVEAGRVFQLSNQRVGLSLLAVQQIISKGKVSQEELRRQLGENLPNALAVAARAYGVTTQELNKMVEGGLDSVDFITKFSAQMRKEVAGNVVQAANTASAAFGRFKTAIFDLETTIASPKFQGGLAALIDFFTKIVKSTQTDISNISKIFGGADDLPKTFTETKAAITDLIKQREDLGTVIRTGTAQEVEDAQKRLASINQQQAALEKLYDIQAKERDPSVMRADYKEALAQIQKRIDLGHEVELNLARQRDVLKSMTEYEAKLVSDQGNITDPSGEMGPGTTSDSADRIREIQHQAEVLGRSGVKVDVLSKSLQAVDKDLAKEVASARAFGQAMASMGDDTAEAKAVLEVLQKALKDAFGGAANKPAEEIDLIKANIKQLTAELSDSSVSLAKQNASIDRYAKALQGTGQQFDPFAAKAKKAMDTLESETAKSTGRSDQLIQKLRTDIVGLTASSERLQTAFQLKDLQKELTNIDKLGDTINNAGGNYDKLDAKIAAVNKTIGAMSPKTKAGQQAIAKLTKQVEGFKGLKADQDASNLERLAKAVKGTTEAFDPFREQINKTFGALKEEIGKGSRASQDEIDRLSKKLKDLSTKDQTFTFDLQVEGLSKSLKEVDDFGKAVQDAGGNFDIVGAKINLVEGFLSNVPKSAKGAVDAFVEMGDSLNGLKTDHLNAALQATDAFAAAVRDAGGSFDELAAKKEQLDAELKSINTTTTQGAARFADLQTQIKAIEALQLTQTLSNFQQLGQIIQSVGGNTDTLQSQIDALTQAIQKVDPTSQDAGASIAGMLAQIKQLEGQQVINDLAVPKVENLKDSLLGFIEETRTPLQKYKRDIEELNQIKAFSIEIGVDIPDGLIKQKINELQIALARTSIGGQLIESFGQGLSSSLQGALKSVYDSSDAKSKLADLANEEDRLNDIVRTGSDEQVAAANRRLQTIEDEKAKYKELEVTVGDVFKNIGRSIVESLTNTLVQNAINGIVNVGLGILGGGIAGGGPYSAGGGLGVLASQAFFPETARGGVARSKHTVLLGERGPEMVLGGIGKAAQGAMVNKPTLMTLGEKGPEVVLNKKQLQQIQGPNGYQAFQALVEQINGKKGQVSGGIERPNLGGGGSGNGMKLKIPGFANGGVVTQPTLAMVGEKGPEVITPVNKMQTDNTVNIIMVNNSNDAEKERQRLTQMKQVAVIAVAEELSKGTGSRVRQSYKAYS